MSEFWVYLRLGFEHIADLKGYDHILFLAALCAVYQLRDWKVLFWMVTAFTVGHTVTLGMATLGVIPVDSDLVEFLIPLTILATSVVNITQRPRPRRGGRSREAYYKYALTLGFGFIHGMGFSNFLRSVLGAEESIVLPLFAFNVGLEAGQVLVVIAVLLVGYFIVEVAKQAQRDWALVLSGAAAGISLTMMAERFPF